jgi:metallophosphoesterase (TIGR00282 family)
LRLLFLGDIFSRPGRDLVRDVLPGLVAREGVDLVLANAENASGGKGLQPEHGRQLLGRGIAALSGGNHSFKHRQSAKYYDEEPRVLRPVNYPEPCPGRGWTVVEAPGGERVGFGNIMGRVFIPFSLDCPFRAADRMADGMARAGCDISIIDFHAEATAEKKAMGIYLDGRVSAVLGTHTHVQTSDCTVLPKGTAYITDAGMTGPQGAVIGMEAEEVLSSLILGRLFRFKVASGMASIQGVIMDFGEDGKALSIRTVNEPDVFSKGYESAGASDGEGDDSDSDADGDDSGPDDDD